MAEGYSRQSTFIDGDVILAEHGNLEFNKLVNVFDKDDGHNHDGTPGGGASIKSLVDETGAQDFVLTPTGVEGSIILDEDDMSSDSEEHLASQQSIKAYVDSNRLDLEAADDALSAVDDALALVDADLQSQIDTFAGNNALGNWLIKTVDYTLVSGARDNIVAATDVDITVPTLTAGNEFTIHNSADSVGVVTILNPSNTIKGPVGSISPGEDLILGVGETAHLVATSSSVMEVV